jgi:hypothetical protein
MMAELFWGIQICFETLLMLLDRAVEGVMEEYD